MPRVAALLLALLLVTTGCEDSVDPTLGTEQSFSLYGYLDPTADRQAIRVVPITSTIAGDTLDMLDVVMTATEPATGRTATWRDSLVTYDDGSRGHVFVADYTPTPGTRVDLVLRGSGEREATASVEIPPLARPEVGPVAADVTGAVYPVTVRGVPRVLDGTLRVFVTGHPSAPSETTALTIPLERLAITQQGSAWTATVPFLGAVRDHLRDIGLFNAGLVLVEAEFRPFVANDEWAVPPGGFDLDAIVEPGTFSNVMNGFGFVGAGYQSPVRWVPSTNVQSLAGFTVTNDPAGRIALNEIGDGYVELFNPTDEAVDMTGYLVSTGSADEGIRIPAPALMASGGFLVVEGPFEATNGVVVQLQTGSGRLLTTMAVQSSGPAWGAFPDGFSYPVPPPGAGPNLFHGPVVASRGAPNRPAAVLAVINEISTSGDGYVEVLATGLKADAVILASTAEALAFSPAYALLETRRPFLVAEEQGGLVLDQIGGTVFLMIGTQVIDARFYEGQAPDRSEGYLPDGPDGTWTTDLRPTRSAANAATRLGL